MGLHGVVSAMFGRAPDTILLVDDEADVRALVRRRLESAGYEVVEAPNGESALSIYRDAPTDIVIADMVMPHMDGRRLISELLAGHPDARVVAISGAFEHDVPELLRESVRLGAIDTLQKPFTSAQLLAAVRNALKAA